MCTSSATSFRVNRVLVLQSHTMEFNLHALGTDTISAGYCVDLLAIYSWPVDLKPSVKGRQVTHTQYEYCE